MFFLFDNIILRNAYRSLDLNGTNNKITKNLPVTKIKMTIHVDDGIYRDDDDDETFTNSLVHFIHIAQS